MPPTSGDAGGLAGKLDRLGGRASGAATAELPLAVRAPSNAGSVSQHDQAVAIPRGDADGPAGELDPFVG